MFTEEQVMLCLAGISYRGYALHLGPRPQPELIRPAIERGLRTVPPLKDNWDLVWGPALYRAPITLFDEKLVYVVRERANPDRYVVVLRGTNPISASDWVFGDLWTARQTPWRYGDGSASVSLSTSISLSIVQSLRSVGPQNSASARLWAAVDEHWSALRGTLGTWSNHRQQLTDPIIRPLRRELVELAQRLSTISVETHLEHEARLQQYLQLWRSFVRARLYDVLDWASARVGQSLDHILLSLIEQEARAQSRFEAGVDLRTFLAGAVEQARGPVSVTVAGHSKAGALASTVALWLAETQGMDVPVPVMERWDPYRRAQVHCYSFAGPTAGDARFAQRSHELLGERCHRVWNKLDLVPHAWTISDLQQVPDLYLPNIKRVGVVTELVEAIEHNVAALDYKHVDGVPRPLCGQYAPEKPNFFAQLAHQHLDAYLIELGLARYGISQRMLFDDRLRAA